MGDTLSEILYRMSLLEQRLQNLETRDTGNPLVIYKTNAGQTFTDGVPAVVDFEDMIYDPHSLVTTGANWVYTVPVSGYYMVSVLITFAAVVNWHPNESIRIRPLIGGAGGHNIGRVSGLPSSSTAASCVGAGAVYAAAGSTIAIEVFQNSDSNISLITTDNLNVASIFRIGAG